MAAAGTPLVAVEDGVIVRARPNGLGGLGITMRGQSGLQYYYAHLSAYAEGLHGGQSVRAGEILGYVGDTGNAKGGSPHLHFEIARNGKPVNPFPILRVTWEWQMPHILEAAAAIEAADGP
jgi:murein DD-endopeptidase MepM/ murein hydrolase activator NlpD